MGIIDELKKEIEFGVAPTCGNCGNCCKQELHADEPMEYFCTYAGKITFKVSEGDTCQKWIEI